MDQIQQNQIKCTNHADKQATHLFVSPPYLFTTIFTCDTCTISDEYYNFTKFALSEIMEDKKDYIIKDLPYLAEPKSLKLFDERVEQLKSQSIFQQYVRSIEDLIHSYTNDFIEAMQQIRKIFLSKQDLLEAREFYDFYFQISQREKLKNLIQNKNYETEFKLSNFFYYLYLDKIKNQQILDQKLEILKQIQQKKDINPLKQELEQVISGVKSLVQRLKKDLQAENCSQNIISQENQNNQISLQKVELKQENINNFNVINIIEDNPKQIVNQNIVDVDKNNKIQQQKQNQAFVNENLNQNQNNLNNKDQNKYLNDNNFQIENKLNVLCLYNQKDSNNLQLQPKQFQENIQQNRHQHQQISCKQFFQVENNVPLDKYKNQDQKNKSMNYEEIRQYTYAKVISKNNINKNNTEQTLNQDEQFKYDKMLQINQNNQDQINKNNNREYDNISDLINETKPKINQQRADIVKFNVKQENNSLKNLQFSQEGVLQNLLKMSLKTKKQVYLRKFVQKDNFTILSQLQEEEQQIGAIDCIINQQMIDQKICIQFQFQNTNMFQAIGLISQDLILKQKNKISFLEDCKQQNLISNKGLCALNFDFVEFQFESNQVIEITVKMNEIVFYNTTTKKNYSQKISFQKNKFYYIGFILSGGQSQFQII